MVARLSSRFTGSTTKVADEAACITSCKEVFERMATESTTVGRQELTKRIASEAKISQKQAAAALEATLDSIREALQGGHEVRLVGFGSFKVRTSAAREGVNPRDHTKKIQVPAKERVRFSPGKELSESVLKK
jgi:nucleoid DNA-binding protein